MICKKCGREIQEGDLFCTHCGSSTDEKIQLETKFNDGRIFKIKLWQAIMAIVVFLSALIGIIFVNAKNNVVQINDIDTKKYISDLDNNKNTISENTKNESSIEENNSNDNIFKQITMDIYVDSDGNAEVTEEWKCNVTSGTEC